MSDLKQAWEYSFIHSSATGRGDEEIGPCLTYEKSVAFGKGCIKQREVFIRTQPEAAPAVDSQKSTEMAINGNSCSPVGNNAAQDLGAAILALPLPMPWNEFVYMPNAGRWTDCGPLTKHAYGSGTEVYTADQMRDLLKAAAALASSANALSEGDRKDAELYREIRKWNPKQFTDAWARALSDKIKFDELVNAAIQAQKDGHAE